MKKPPCPEQIPSAWITGSIGLIGVNLPIDSLKSELPVTDKVTWILIKMQGIYRAVFT